MSSEDVLCKISSEEIIPQLANEEKGLKETAAEVVSKQSPEENVPQGTEVVSQVTPEANGEEAPEEKVVVQVCERKIPERAPEEQVPEEAPAEVAAQKAAPEVDQCVLNGSKKISDEEVVPQQAIEELGTQLTVEEPAPQQSLEEEVRQVPGESIAEQPPVETVPQVASENIASQLDQCILNGPRKVAMSTSMDTEAVRSAYNEVRADNSDTQWAVFKYDGANITCSAKGTSFDEFRSQFSDDERGFGYIRLQTGDEMSKRQKFLLLTWIGPSVSVLKRAKMSTDKSLIKAIISNFAVEIQLETLQEFELSDFIDALNKAGGANYGTGV